MAPTLPTIPKDLGTIRHVFQSSLSAIRGESNALGLPKKRKVGAILVDGLGAEQILARTGHARFLAEHLEKAGIGYAAFPATTSSNIGSFATGLMPGEHGLVGHQVLDRSENIRINLLTGWTEQTIPEVWQPNPTVSEQAASYGIPTYVIAAAEYENTGYTRATMRNVQFITAESIADRFAKLIELFEGNSEALCYLYIPELDKYGHRNGWQSPGWSALLEEVDGELAKLSTKLGADSAVIVTADHGMVDTSLEHHLILDNYFDSSLEWFGGDTRAGYVYLNDLAATDSLLKRLESITALASAHKTDELIAAGYFGSVSELAKARLPEIVLLAKGRTTMFHTEYSKKKSFEMIAHHGSVSSSELRIPLVRIGF